MIWSGLTRETVAPFGLELDVRSLDRAGLVDVDGALEGLALVGLGADADLLEVQDDFGDVFDDAFDRLELVLDAFVSSPRRSRRLRWSSGGCGVRELPTV